MEVPDKIHPLGWLRKQLEADGGTDLIREMVQAFAEVLMSAEASALCGAGYGERSEDPGQLPQRLPARAFDTRAGSMALAIPKLRHDTYLPEWLLAPRRRAERALVGGSWLAPYLRHPRSMSRARSPLTRAGDGRRPWP